MGLQNFQREETTSRRPQSKFEMPQNGEQLEGQQRMSKTTRRMAPSSLNTNANLNDQWLTPKRKQNYRITSRKTNNTKLIQPFRVLVRIRLQRTIYLHFSRQFEAMTHQETNPLKNPEKMFHVTLKHGASVPRMPSTLRNRSS